jgi:hypothetical protein
MANRIDIARREAARGRIIRTLATQYPGWLSTDILRATVSGEPGGSDYVSENDLARDLTYLEQGGFIEERDEDDKVLFDETVRFARLTSRGLDLWEGREKASGILIRR